MRTSTTCPTLRTSLTSATCSPVGDICRNRREIDKSSNYIQNQEKYRQSEREREIKECKASGDVTPFTKISTQKKINDTNLRDVYEAGAAVLEAEEGTVAHDVLHLGGHELARVLQKKNKTKDEPPKSQHEKNTKCTLPSDLTQERICPSFAKTAHCVFHGLNFIGSRKHFRVFMYIRAQGTRNSNEKQGDAHHILTSRLFKTLA